MNCRCTIPCTWAKPQIQWANHIHTPSKWLLQPLSGTINTSHFIFTGNSSSNRHQNDLPSPTPSPKEKNRMAYLEVKQQNFSPKNKKITKQINKPSFRTCLVFAFYNTDELSTKLKQVRRVDTCRQVWESNLSKS